MSTLIYFHSSSATSFSLSITIGISIGTSAGPSQSTSATGCRPGLWRITYTNGFPAGGPGGTGVNSSLDVIGDYYGLNPASGFTEWHNRGFEVAGYAENGTMAGIRSPATLYSAGVYESYICSGLPVEFQLQTDYTTYYNGLTIAASGTWLTSCG